ncbi:MAG: S8 family peptidase [Planctomycetes bacterium]|nr:S8 family peptidase [Planctomycetota bacterium]
MRSSHWLASLLAILSPAAAAAQAPQEKASPTGRQTVPQGAQGARSITSAGELRPPASALDPEAQRAKDLVRRPGVDAGSPVAFRAAVSDEAPLPVPARVKTGPNGDVVLEPASGDPYFLGFAAGDYYPPKGERIDPQLLRNVQAAYGDGRPNQETYGFVMLEKRITEERIAALTALGARVLEFHPHNCLKVALPIFSLESIAAAPDVRWVGVARPAQKVHPRLVEQLAQARAGDSLDVYIDVFDSDLNAASVVESFGSVSQFTAGVIQEGNDTARPQRTQSNGWQQLALQGLGVEVLEYVETIRAFRARITPTQIESLLALDFVQFLESNEAPSPAHDFSTALIASDNVRAYFSGGTNSVVSSGQVDSGFDAGHWDLNHTNGVGWDLSGSATGAWHDGCTHGSHVAGTLLGNGGSGALELKGNAPGLGWGGAGRHYNLKIFNDGCGFGGASMASMLGLLRSSFFDGVSTTPRPMVVSNSWGTSPGATPFRGTEADARLLDDEVYFQVQGYVFSSGNNGAGKVGLQPGAKNVLTVGSVQAYTEPGFGSVGDLAWDSSTGPMGDSRWKPNVVAPGVDILSVSANTTTGHKYFSGTSMAAPHVSGTLTQLLDNYPWLRYSPSRTDCLVMASAVTKDNQQLSTPSDAHLRQFGTGRIDATKAMWGTGGGDSGWINWGFFMSSNTYSSADFTVNPGCTRLVVCMHYKESQASSGASVALKNNWDLYLDQPPIDPNFNTGDWFAQQSSIDNTEIRILDFPVSGVWRWKTWPTSTTTGCDMAVTVYAYYGSTTPDLTVTSTQSATYVRPGVAVDFTGWVYNPESLASGVSLTPDLAGATLIDSLRSLADGTVAHFMDNYPSYGRSVTLGDMFPGQWKGNIWQLVWGSEGVKNLSVSSSSDNALDHVATAQVVVDGTAPSDVTNLTSTTHTPFTWTSDNNLSMVWDAATDNLSGVAGYSVEFSTGSPVFPDGTVDVFSPDAGAFGLPSVSASNGYYVSVVAVDQAGNVSTNVAAMGPYFIDVDAPLEPANVVSTSHVVGAPDCNSLISMQWDDGSDAHSAVQGYAALFDNSPSTDLTGSPVVVVGTGNPFFVQDVGASNADWYFHVATVDVAGNTSATITQGPYRSAATPSVYCVAKLNSLGCFPDINYSGTASASATSGFTVLATEVRNNKPGLVLYSVTGAASQPFQGGTLCLQAPVRRSTGVNSGGLPSGNDCSGMLSIDMNSFAAGLLGGTPSPALLVVGTDVWCQWWSRDPGFPAPNNSSLSNALTYRVCN